MSMLDEEQQERAAEIAGRADPKRWRGGGGDSLAYDRPKVFLNIGLNTRSGGSITANRVLDVLEEHLGMVAIREWAVQPSDTEPTLVVRLNYKIDDSQAYLLSDRCEQDCIAQLDGGRGTLHGYKAREWGPFDPKRFLLLDGTRAG